MTGRWRPCFRVEFDLSSSLTPLVRRPPPPSSITVIIALCRVKVFVRCLQTMATLGIKQIHVIDTVLLPDEVVEPIRQWIEDGAAL